MSITVYVCLGRLIAVALLAKEGSEVTTLDERDEDVYSVGSYVDIRHTFSTVATLYCG